MTPGAFRQYTAERFPVGPYLVLIAAMVAGASASVSAGSLAPVSLGLRSAVSVLLLLLAFFHLRVFDEHKDYAKDLLAHPGRVLSRGVVTLADLRIACAVAIALELALGAWLGRDAFLWVVAALAFSVAMRFEFGAGAFLNRHIVLYALTHNPVVGLLIMAVTSGILGTTSSSLPVLVYVALASVTSLGFEVGRKFRALQDEKPGQDTYTQALGIPQAATLLIVVEVVSATLCGPLIQTFAARAIVAALASVAVFAVLSFRRDPSPRLAKAVELGATVLALGLYLTITVEVGVRQGFSFLQ